jgi:hypothetical protein
MDLDLEDYQPVSDFNAYYRPVLSSERALYMKK